MGGSAQTPVMKKSVGSIRLDLAQYREMKVFSQFGGDLDELTMRELRYGEGLMRLLCQKNAEAMSLSEQVITLICAQERLFADVPAKDIKKLQKELLNHFKEKCGNLCFRIEQGKVLTDAIKNSIVKEARVYLAGFRL